MNSSVKIAIVTGGSRGLGRDMALSLAKKGHHVILTYRGEEAGAQQTVKDIQSTGPHAVALQLDLKELGGLDLFVEQVKDTLKKEFKLICQC